MKKALRIRCVLAYRTQNIDMDIHRVLPWLPSLCHLFLHTEIIWVDTALSGLCFFVWSRQYIFYDEDRKAQEMYATFLFISQL